MTKESKFKMICDFCKEKKYIDTYYANEFNNSSCICKDCGLKIRKLERDYPHNCFCGRKLHFYPAYNSARKKKFTEKQFINLWKDNRVFLLCCDCYGKAKCLMKLKQCTVWEVIEND